MLIKALRGCFSASNKFTKNTIQLVLDKLNSNLEEAQLDALETFTECARLSYDPNDYKEYIESLWNLFHRFTMNATKSNIEEAALAAIEALSFSLSRCVQKSDASSSSSPIVSSDWFVGKAVDSCLVYLNEPDLKLVWPNVKCLQAVASASSTTNLLVIKQTVPALIQHYNKSAQVKIHCRYKTNKKISFKTLKCQQLL
jgi:hypothetical protein